MRGAASFVVVTGLAFLAHAAEPTVLAVDEQGSAAALVEVRATLTRTPPGAKADPDGLTFVMQAGTPALSIESRDASGKKLDVLPSVPLSAAFMLRFM